MGFVVGLKEEFLKGKRELINKAKEIYFSTGSWEEVERFVRDSFREDLSFKRFNLFTYFLLVGGLLLLPTLFLWKFVFEEGTFLHFIFRVIFIVSAMFALKGIVGHYVVVFLNRDRFEAELKALKVTLEGGKDGTERNH